MSLQGPLLGKVCAPPTGTGQAPRVPGAVQGTEAVQIDKDDAKENEQKLFITQSLLWQGASQHHACFGRDSKAGRKWGSFIVKKKRKEKKGKVQVCLEWWRGLGELDVG